MAVTMTPVNVYQCDYTCDSCKEGVMRPDGTASLSLPPIYRHQCTKCGYLEDFKDQYPIIQYVPTNQTFSFKVVDEIESVSPQN